MIKLIQGDITTLEVHAIVNAANPSLMGGGGVDGAIHRAAGVGMHRECMSIARSFGDCPTGHAVITSGGDLPAKFIIHTVGPIWHGGHDNEEALLVDCYRNSILLAHERGIETMAFPNISTGVYGFPKQRAAEIALQTVKTVLKEHKLDMEITFITADDENYRIYQDLMKK